MVRCWCCRISTAGPPRPVIALLNNPTNACPPHMQYFFLRNADTMPQQMGLFLLAVAFASSAVTIVSGALAERCKLIAYFVFSAMMAGFVYPVVSHWCALASRVGARSTPRAARLRVRHAACLLMRGAGCITYPTGRF